MLAESQYGSDGNDSSKPPQCLEWVRDDINESPLVAKSAKAQLTTVWENNEFSRSISGNMQFDLRTSEIIDYKQRGYAYLSLGGEREKRLHFSSSNKLHGKLQ